jgi:hypothetical protein
MTKPNTLSDRQLMLLSNASQRDDLLLTRPENLRGGAAKAVLAKLRSGGLVAEVAVGAADPHWRKAEDRPIGLKITPAGLQAIGVEPKAAGADKSAAEAAPETTGVARPADPVARGGRSAGKREGTKRALVLALLARDQGASLGEITAATGWLRHSARAALTGLRQSGHAISRTRTAENTTVYHRIAAAETTSAPVVQPAAEA